MDETQVQVGFRLPESERKRLVAAASAYDLSQSQIIRRALTAWLDAQPKQPDMFR